MGLLLGASVLTVCEIIDLFVYNSFVKCLKPKKNKEKPFKNGTSTKEPGPVVYDNYRL